MPRSSSLPTSPRPHRLPFLNFMPERIRNHFIAMAGEFAGTFLFLFFAFSGAQVANTKVPDAAISSAPDPASLLYISLSFGFSLAVNAWVFFRISGGLFNPAGTSVAQGLFIEMFLTAQLVFTIFMLAAEKHKATYIAPVGIGLSLFVAELTGVYYTGGSVNPARSFGPSVVLHSFYKYDWIELQIYWLGPVFGALLVSGFYEFIKMLEYETANPGQDFDDQEHEFFDPSRDTSRPIVNLAPDGSAQIVDETIPTAHEPHPDCLAPHSRQAPESASQRRQPPSNSRGGIQGTDSAGAGGYVSGEAASSEARYHCGPDIEAAKASHRHSGSV
ncbi:MAG: hypothetical protein Q9206_001158 [Seirophora lacunosa]